MMCEESEPPLSEEFSRVVNETQLGDPVVDALDRMAQRLDVRDVEWVVQAIRIQQTVGGRLADLLHTLADFIRAREEIRREVDVLTAEGRISAWVLGALPVFLLVAISVMNPGYMDSMFRGWGYVWLTGAGISVVTGVLVINKMVKVDV
jgi:tight adherence protein B